ncbi:MAG TPA: PIN domain-containing protein [Candidatus Goldiibacteriota bacterium]|nr:PIN domain-containing protein [Candidatus Goldiibacteriota bacterium]HRQ43861.1 PIN domain-containing protein [Candidatus Goldiibacteriota bacterium]
MKTALFDANVLLDIHLKRKGAYNSSMAAVAAAKRHGVKTYLSAVSISIIHYIIEKETGRTNAIKILEKIRMLFDIAPVDAKAVDMAIVSDFKDFEDALQYYSAIGVNADCIVTGKKKDYKHSAIPVLAPEEFQVYLNGGI